MLEVGSAVPFFEGICDDGEKVSSLSLKGGFFVLYFYPKDDTPGCTIEANDFNNFKKQFEELNCKIIGVSKDSIKSHNKFKEKYCLNFPLISDEKMEICKIFNVLKEKSMFGKKYLGISRDTFLINKEGKIAFIWQNVSAAGHALKVLEKLKSL